MGNMDSMYREIPKSDKIMVALRCQADPGKVNRQDPKLLEPIDTGDYVDMLKEFLPINKDAGSWVEQILSDGLLARRVWLIQTDNHLQHHFGAECIMKIVPFGFGSGGEKFTEEELGYGAHLMTLMIDPELDQTIYGFTSEPSYIHKLLPKEFDVAEFKVPKYESDRYVTDVERQNIAALYTKAYLALKESLKGL